MPSQQVLNVVDDLRARLAGLLSESRQTPIPLIGHVAKLHLPQTAHGLARQKTRSIDPQQLTQRRRITPICLLLLALFWLKQDLLIDEWTMIRRPDGYEKTGTNEHVVAMERLMYIALAGPVVELHHRQIPCVLPNVQQFKWDWQRMWTSAAHLRLDESQRMDLLAQRTTSSSAVVIYGEPSIFYSQLVPQLLERGALPRAEVQATFDHVRAEIKAVQEAESKRESRRSQDKSTSRKRQTFGPP